MKRFLKYLLILFFIPFLSFTFVSLLFSSEKSITWLFESVSEELGYQSNILVSDLDWSLTKSRIVLGELSIQDEERGNSIYTDSAVLSINLLNIVSSIDLYPFNLIEQKNFLLVELVNATVQLKNFNLNESYSRNKFTNFILNNSQLRLDELNIKGSIKEVDIPKYFYLFSNTEEKGNPQKISIEDSLISTIKLGPLELQETRLKMKASSKNLEFVASNSEFEGIVIVKQPIKDGIEITLSSLKLSSKNFNNSNLFVYLLDNLTIPISFSVDKLFLREKDIGRLSFLVSKDEERLSFKKIVFSGFGLDLGKRLEDEPSERSLLSIFRKDDQVNTRFQGNISTKNLTDSLLGLEEEGDKGLNFLAGAGNLNLDINWEGLPSQFDVNKIQGNLSFRADDFVTKEVESDFIGSSDFLKIISLFNVSNTFGDLTNINFKEKFNKGFQADRVEGSLEFKRDQIKTSSPIVFKSGSGEFKWDGFIQKTKEGELDNLDFDIVITLPLREYLPAYALILGGPVTAATVFIAGKAFKKPLNKLSSGKWKITGTIEDPNTEFVEWFE
ncbi:uncharacterized protein METZ01_LOCUS29365 [marine metagenome]|uniref:YhdP central domain-containing protein n=1 Tax=marine metagenome TaxID=408172 RepID=A0A381QB09_9ZZZZ